VIWYVALKRLSAMQATTVQLPVPPIAAFGAVLLLSETPGWCLAISSAAILGGIALVPPCRAHKAKGPPRDESGPVAIPDALPGAGDGAQ